MNDTAPAYINPSLHGLLRPIDSLTLDPRNARAHPQRNLDAIKKSLERFGLQRALIVRDGVVVAGNGTLACARELGWQQIAAVEFRGTPQEAAALAVIDNRSAELATWDVDNLSGILSELPDDLRGLTGFNDDEIGAMLPDELPPGDPDEAPPTPESPVSRLGDLWVLGKHRLLCGDSTSAEDVALLMGGEVADLLITDPPYGVSYADKNAFLNTIAKGHRIQEAIANDHKTAEEMNAFWSCVLANAHTACSEKASYYIFSPQGGDLMMMMSIQHAKWQLKHMLVWVKNNHVLGRCDYHYKHEPVFFGWKENGTHEFFGGSSCFSVLSFDKPMKNDLHPTMKPVALCQQLIENSTRRGALVLDLFLGSGSTMIAAETAKRRCFGVELSQHYADVIVQRWQTFTNRTAVLASTGQTFDAVREERGVAPPA